MKIHRKITRISGWILAMPVTRAALRARRVHVVAPHVVTPQPHVVAPQISVNSHMNMKNSEPGRQKNNTQSCTVFR